MPEAAIPRMGWLRRFREQPRDSAAKTLVVALAVCGACSVLVSSAAVLLRPRQLANREAERQAHIRAIVASQPGLEDMFEAVGDQEVRARVVELASGEYADWIDAAGYDQRRAALDPLESVELPAERDVAHIGRRAKYAVAYVVLDGGRIALLLLPVHGQGYASTIRGYVALAGDGNTVRGLSIYDHGETPGVGGEVLADEDWLAQFSDKRVRDASGRVRIGVAATDEVDPDSPDAPYHVDGVSGATRTAGGVDGMLRFWLGDDGFGPFLQRVRDGGGAR